MNANSDDAFVREHEPLVRKLAARVRAQLELTTGLDELMAYGFQGLLEARARFDPEKGVPFRTFAYYRIRGAILDGVRQMAYLPRKVHARRKAAEVLDRAAEEAAEQRGRRPASRTDSRAALEAIDGILGRTCAAYVIAAVGQDETAARPGPEAQMLRREARGRVRDAVAALPERERALVEGHFFQDRTLDELGQELGISKSWASRLCTRALGRLREDLEGSLED